MTDPLRAPLRAVPVPAPAPEPAPGCVIDCDTCAVRGDACADCVVSVMLGGPPDVVPPVEVRALDVLAEAGLVPPLRATPSTPGPGASRPRDPTR